MPATISATRGDERTEELIAKNDLELPPVPPELEEFAAANTIHIYNCSTDTFRVQHPLLGVVTIFGKEDGEEVSRPTVIPGLIKYGVPVDMKLGEIRHESGRQFAVDLLGIGAFKDSKNSLWRRGVFIASQNTFNPEKSKSFRIGSSHGKASNITLPEWVDLRVGKCSSEPSKKEIEAGNARAREWDTFLVAEADSLSDQGSQKDIQAEHRHAARRLGQSRPWDQPLRAMVDCPGCGIKILPDIAVHNCGAVINWDKAIFLGIKQEEDRPGHAAKK